MLHAALQISPLPAEIRERLQKIHDFYICTTFTQDMIGPSIAVIDGTVHYRFMNFFYLPQPPESLTPEQVKLICDVRLSHFDELVNKRLNEQVVDAIIACTQEKILNLEQQKNVLDFGCGSGLASILIKHHLPYLEIEGVDISSEALISYREKGFAGFLIEPEGPLPFDTARFDLIFAVFVMHFNVDLSMLAELRRVLRSDGLFVFNIYQRDTDGVIDQLEEVGFSEIQEWRQLAEIGSSHKILCCKRPV